MTRWVRWWAVALAVSAVGTACKEHPKPPPYVPERAARVEDAAPPPPPPVDAGMLGDDKSVKQCVKDCVAAEPATSESAETIRIRCLDICEGRCVDRCLERAKRRGFADGGLVDDCAEICRLE